MSAGPTTRPIGSVVAELLAARVELVAEERCRQRRVDEAGGDQVHPDRCELERQAPMSAGSAAVSAEMSASPGRRGGRRCRP